LFFVSRTELGLAAAFILGDSASITRQLRSRPLHPFFNFALPCKHRPNSVILAPTYIVRGIDWSSNTPRCSFFLATASQSRCDLASWPSFRGPWLVGSGSLKAMGTCAKSMLEMLRCLFIALFSVLSTRLCIGPWFPPYHLLSGLLSLLSC
jgi:hypothetical protein